MKEQFKAWAIDTRSSEGHGFIGRYWWCFGRGPTIPPQNEGCQVALWKTRREAKEALPDTRRAFSRSKVVSVKITIENLTLDKCNNDTHDLHVQNRGKE